MDEKKDSRGVSSFAEETGPCLDAAAFTTLLDTLHPLPPAMLFFELETFLSKPEAAPPAEPGLTIRALLDDNRAPGRSLEPTSQFRLAPVDADLVARHDPATSVTEFSFRTPSVGVRGVHSLEQRGARLVVEVGEEDGFSKVVNTPLQVVMAGWGDVQVGALASIHTLELKDDCGSLLERWHFVSIGSGYWLQCMDDFEREVRAGTNRQFAAAWKRYAGPARIVMTSELVAVNLTEEAALAWEEAEVDLFTASGNCLNVVPGGLNGMRVLRDSGLVTAPRVSIQEREAAVVEEVDRALAHQPPPGTPHILAFLWKGDEFRRHDPLGQPFPTPAEAYELRRTQRAA